MDFLLSSAQTDFSTTIVNLGIILLSGLIMGRLFEQIKIPAVTGYLVAGLILGPITGYFNVEDLNNFSIVGDIALGFIAFQVGNELWFGKLKKTGTKIAVITIVQAIITSSIVILATMNFVDISVALVLGAVAAATAPAPIMMIIKKYRTKGELTDTILPVVGLDDAVGVIMFGILLSISVSLAGSTGETMNFLHMVTEPLMEIGLSIVLGVGIGFISGKTIKYISHNTERQEKNLNVVLIAVLLTVGAAILTGGSPILAPMIAGTVVTNLINKECYVLEEETIRFFVPPLMIAFFTIAGAQLDFKVVISAGLVGALYIVGRAFGKFFGAYLGCTIVKSSQKVRKYLGVSLLPQSGVAIGLSVAAFSELAPVNIEYANIVKNVILASVLFFALIGPILVKIALFASGEVTANAHVKKGRDVKWKNTQVLQK
jgi:Kef-type K+ transport system membrane component KefB